MSVIGKELFLLSVADVDGLQFNCTTYLPVSNEDFRAAMEWWNRPDRIERMDDTDAWIAEINALPFSIRLVVTMLMTLTEALDDRLLTVAMRSNDEVREHLATLH